MDVLSAAGLNPNIANESRSDSELAGAKLGEDLDDFLNLLIVQLQYQDPSDPMDPDQMTAQIAQLSTVEQAIATNKNLEKIVDVFEGTQDSNIVSYTGKFAEVEGTNINVKEEGSTQFSYELGEDIEAAFIQITDSTGRNVYNGEGTTNSGRNAFDWDGIDVNGERVAAGNYTVKVTSRNSDNITDEVITSVGGRVDGVNFASTPPALIVNGAEVAVDSIKYIGDPV